MSGRFDVSGSPAIMLAAQGPGKTVGFDVWGYQAQSDLRQIKNVHLQLDFSGLARVATFSVADRFCSTVGTTVSCLIPSIGNAALGAGNTQIPVTFDPRPHAAGGLSGGISYSVTAPGTQGSQGTEQLTLGHGPDLVVTSPAPSEVSLSPGERFAPEVMVSNRGDVTAKSVTLVMGTGYELQDMDRSDNCRYEPQPDASYAYTELVVCTFGNLDIKPGQTYELVRPILFKVRPDAFDGYYIGFEFDLGMPSFPLKDWIVGTGAPLRLVLTKAPHVVQSAGQTNLQPNGNELDFNYQIITKNVQDPAAVVSRVSGHVGQTVPVIIGFRNDGTGAIDNAGPALPTGWITFSVPRGTEAVGVPKGGEYRPECMPVINGQVHSEDVGKPGYSEYYCVVYPGLRAGATYTLTFDLKIKQVVPNAMGKVVVGPASDGPIPKGPSKWDANIANDTAYVVVNPTKR